MLHIYNTLTHQKERFIPLNANQIGLYVCGITVYDYCHIGHARVFVAFDIIVRFLRASGWQVKYIRNITDIDDKIIKRANENNESIQNLTNRFIQAMNEDAQALNVLAPDEEPRATEHIPTIITMIQKLQDNGIAYLAENGDVYFQVEHFESYGCLAHKNLEQLQAGARVNVIEEKRSPLDFVLWKKAKPNEPSWPSPWGEGRPGWHIECSAMSTACLGNTFDIHGGGIDLVFPHHENERAQSEGATHEPFVKTWMHIGFVQIDKEKMSKSLNNFFTIKDVLKQYDSEVIRYFLVASHYRSPVNYSEENLEQAKHALERLYTALRGIKISNVTLPLSEALLVYEQRFNEAMNDDFNTPVALSVLFDCVHAIHTAREKKDPSDVILAAILKKLANVLGFLERDPESYFQGERDNVSEIENLIAEREKARQAKNWALADEYRQKLMDMNIVLEDTAKGTVWRKVI